MCLLTYWKKPKTAHKDITVYKVLVMTICKDGVVKYRAPFYPLMVSVDNFFYYEPGKTHKPVRNFDEEKIYCGKPYIRAWEDNRPILDSQQLEITNGWLHSYALKKTADDVVRDRNRFNYMPTIKDVVVEMVVPKGSRYYESASGLEIASDTLVWKNITTF